MKWNLCLGIWNTWNTSEAIVLNDEWLRQYMNDFECVFVCDMHDCALTPQHTNQKYLQRF